ncbi:MAG: penicillin-binding protein 2 [Caldiserica bacterium]|jgi:penicillin-binding protein 2|nr:penicillin-binding protein 2 [Caldisericota bacterium]MDH7562487.1 penicillin-binding protein 2 [Caldisericota bacterium]
MKWKKPFLAFALLCFFVLFVLWGRLFYLQVVKGEEFQVQSEENRTRLVSTPAIRGAIYDRNGVCLAKDQPTYSVKIVPDDFKEEALPVLSSILSMPVEEIRAKLSENSLPPWEPYSLRSGLGEDVAQKIEEQHLKLPGVILQVEPKRVYPFNNLFSHIVGYVGEISREELSSLGEKGYVGGDTIGKTGLERYYEDYLKGEKGKQVIMVNALGQPIKVLYEIEPKPGNDLILSIDQKLQEKARQILVENQMNGAIVCLDPRNGEILAMASTPDFDPNQFVKGISQKEYNALLESQALIPKCTQDRFPPGSTFKVITTISALEEKVIDPKTFKVVCPGYKIIGDRIFYCWQTSGHGEQDLIEAIANSCNVFFYTLALEVGPEKMAKWARIFNLDGFTGVDLPEEARGVIPDPDWKERVTGEQWYPGDTANMGIGQGDVLVTPLGLANLYATIANGGTLYVPHLVKEIRTYDGTLLQTIPPVVKSQIPISQETLSYIREGMVRAADRGTTQKIKLEGVSVAAKTGTAQITSEKQDIWIAAYAPVENPQIVVVIMDEYSKLPYGSYLAPFAHELLKVFFSPEVTTP